MASPAGPSPSTEVRHHQDDLRFVCGLSVLSEAKEELAWKIHGKAPWFVGDLWTAKARASTKAYVGKPTEFAHGLDSGQTESLDSSTQPAPGLQRVVDLRRGLTVPNKPRLMPAACSLWVTDVSLAWPKIVAPRTRLRTPFCGRLLPERSLLHPEDTTL